ncbi:thioesterase II family protein [Streptomyces sp. NPDC048448]|uniref:thioesterase II family protein n=1 Tax=unclassified Streptomyces TaxID=2593676 RepID=UPI002E3298E2|nr:alpha/beta fold hydrolase [Streptomyces sp. NBC_01455]
MTKQQTSNGTWLRQLHPAPASGPRLICFPHAGGSASYFFRLSRAMHPMMEVLAVQYPGRQDRRTEPFADSLEELADHIVAELRTLPPRPLVLFGHSMGATVAFEVARRWEQRGGEVLALLASGRRAPSCVRAEQAHTLDDAAFVTELRKLSGTDQQIFDDEQFLAMFLPAIRSDYRLVDEYRLTPGRRLRCPVVGMVGDDDPQVTLTEARSWADHTMADFALRVYDGGHFYLNTHTDEVVKEITACARTTASS